MKDDAGKAAKALKALREQAGLSMADIARAVGKKKSSYQHYEDKYKKDFLPPELTKKLAPVFEQHGIAPALVYSLAGLGAYALLDEPEALPPVPRPETTAMSEPATDAFDLSPIPVPHKLFGAGNTRDLPVRGHAVGGQDGWFALNGDVLNMVGRPPALQGVREGFAVYVQGTSMEPRYFEGEIVYVDPTRPARKGAHVVVELHHPDRDTPIAVIKRLVAKTPSKVVLAQYNPRRDDIDYPLERIKGIYPIVAAGEFGI